jgi:excisionase family DNA binding protein
VPNVDRFLTANEVCDALRISRTTFYTLVRDGRIPSIKVGKKHLVPAVAIQRMERSALGDDDTLAA